jgi:coenzyme F420-reducing hydrogenase delta subunit
MVMLQKIGLSPQRLRVDYISAAEGTRFAEVIREIDADMKTLGKAKIRQENLKMNIILENLLKRRGR